MLCAIIYPFWVTWWRKRIIWIFGSQTIIFLWLWAGSGLSNSSASKTFVSPLKEKILFSQKIVENVIDIFNHYTAQMAFIAQLCPNIFWCFPFVRSATSVQTDHICNPIIFKRFFLFLFCQSRHKRADSVLQTQLALTSPWAELCN